MSRLDDFLDKHPRLDTAYIELRHLRRAPSEKLESWKMQRKWRPGVVYMDHGSMPCVLVQLSGDMLEGIRLHDGRALNSDLYACGPELVQTKEEIQRAMDIVEMLRADAV